MLSNRSLTEDTMKCCLNHGAVTVHRVDFCSFNERLNVASEHLIAYLDAESTPVIGTTYSHLSQLISRISDSGHFNLLTSGIRVNSVIGQCPGVLLSQHCRIIFLVAR